VDRKVPETFALYDGVMDGQGESTSFPIVLAEAASSAECQQPLDPVETHRRDEFRRLGFDESWSYALAIRPSYDVDVEFVRRLLAAGCPVLLAAAIVY
jgi:GT2 family glycosyltransferase